MSLAHVAHRDDRAPRPDGMIMSYPSYSSYPSYEKNTNTPNPVGVPAPNKNSPLFSLVALRTPEAYSGFIEDASSPATTGGA